MLWLYCKAGGKGGKEEVETKLNFPLSVETKLNFPLSDYCDDETTALQGLTKEGMVNTLQQEGRGGAQHPRERDGTTSRYRGVHRGGTSGRCWVAQCSLGGGKQTGLG